MSATDFASMTAPIQRTQSAATKGKPTRAVHPARVEPERRCRIAYRYAAGEKVAFIAAEEHVAGPTVIRCATEYGLPLRGRGGQPRRD